MHERWLFECPCRNSDTRFRHEGANSKIFGILNSKFVYSPFVKATSRPLPVGTIIARLTLVRNSLENEHEQKNGKSARRFQ